MRRSIRLSSTSLERSGSRGRSKVDDKLLSSIDAKFKPRVSLLDSTTTPCDLTEECPDEDAYGPRDKQTVEFTAQPFGRQIQGWIHLFWFMVSFYIGTQWYCHYQRTGALFGPDAWKLIRLAYPNFMDYSLVTMCLIALSLLAVPLELACQTGTLPRNGLFVWLLRHAFAISPIGIACYVVIHQSWSPIMTLSILMHSMVFFMKIHSYLAQNEALAMNYAQIKRKRLSQIYPANLTVHNFVDFLLVPTLIYQPVYPRTPRIRKAFILDRILGIGAIFFMLYAIISIYIMPVIMNVTMENYLDVVIKLLLPLTLSLIFCFFLVFEYMLNMFAEITRFADRHFYDDWWNSLDYAEFARKWNVPVHRFLQHHIYFAARNKRGWGKQAAALWTFFISSILHELIMSMVAGRPLFVFFCCQMFQIPFISMSNKLGIKNWPKTANIMFWISTFLGTTLLAAFYSLKF